MSAARTTARPMRAAALTAAALVCLAALAGCSRGASGNGTSGSRAADSGGGSAAGDLAAPQAGESAKASGSTPATARLSQAALLTEDRSIVYRGELTVRVRSVAAAVARAESVATASGGFVFAEQTARPPGRRGAVSAQLTLKVPADRFRTTLARLSGLGHELSRQQSADDVTSEVVDVGSRLRTQRRSVARMQALLDRATTVGEIVRVEGELSRREADLESLEAQQAKLTSLTELATIDLTLERPAAAPVPVESGTHLGFLSGLRGGWDALVAVLVVALTAAGAALPFALLLALVGVPVLVVLRRRRLVTRTAVGAPPAA